MSYTPSRSVVALFVLFLLLGFGPAEPGWAQAPAPAATDADSEAAAEAAEPEEPEVARDSPRASL